MAIPNFVALSSQRALYLSCVGVRGTLLVVQRCHLMLSLRVPWRWCVSLFSVCWYMTPVNTSCWCASLQVAWLVLVETELTATYYLSFTLCLPSLWPWVCAGWEGDLVPHALVQREWAHLGDEQLGTDWRVARATCPVPRSPPRVAPRKRCQVQAELSHGVL